VAEKNNELVNQLLTGQHKLEADVTDLIEGQKRLETDVSELKTDVSELKTDVSELKTDVSELKTDVSELKTDVAELKTDVSELKTDVAELKTDVADLKEGQRRTELFLLNMENRILPVVNATYEGMKLLTEQIATVQKTQIEHSDKLENHELRILKLEHTK